MQIISSFQLWHGACKFKSTLTYITDKLPFNFHKSLTVHLFKHLWKFFNNLYRNAASMDLNLTVSQRIKCRGNSVLLVCRHKVTILVLLWFRALKKMAQLVGKKKITCQWVYLVPERTMLPASSAHISCSVHIWFWCHHMLVYLQPTIIS